MKSSSALSRSWSRSSPPSAAAGAAALELELELEEAIVRAATGRSFPSGFRAARQACRNWVGIGMTRAIWGLGVNKNTRLEKEEEQRVESTQAAAGFRFLVGKQRMRPLAGSSRRIVILAANSDRSNGGWVRLE